MRFLLAAKLFELRPLSLGKASELAGLPRLRFMDELGRRQIPVINLAEDQISDELVDQIDAIGRNIIQSADIEEPTTCAARGYRPKPWST